MVVLAFNDLAFEDAKAAKLGSDAVNPWENVHHIRGTRPLRERALLNSEKARKLSQQGELWRAAGFRSRDPDHLF